MQYNAEGLGRSVNPRPSIADTNTLEISLSISMYGVHEVCVLNMFSVRLFSSLSRNTNRGKNEVVVLAASVVETDWICCFAIVYRPACPQMLSVGVT